MASQREVELARGRSVQNFPDHQQTPTNVLTLMLASVADDIVPWGQNVIRRDWQLRNFWPTESVLASAIFTLVARNAAFSWTLDGPPRTVAAMQRIMHQSDGGRGWQSFIIKLEQDVFTQDNGAFMEIIRATDSPTSPVVGLGVLDSARCRRTGNPAKPVIYWDRNGAPHELKEYQVADLTDFPSPIETMYGVQLCAVSRVLRAAQVLKDIAIHTREKVGGYNPSAIHLISGIKDSEVSDAIARHQQNQTVQGFIRYVKPVILGTLDPNATISHEQIDIASLPDGFDPDVSMRWYINNLANGFGGDYQDFAPLPGRGLGTSAQSMILHEKSRGRGPALFMKMIEYIMNFKGVMPKTVTFRYDEQDMAAEAEQADLDKTRAETRKLYIEVGVLTPQAAQQQMLDEGSLSQEEYDALSEEGDLTEDVTAEDEVRVGESARKRKPRKKRPGDPGYQAKKENLADFEETERQKFESDYQAAVALALRQSFTSLKPIILGTSKGRIPFGRKQGPEDALTDLEWWESFRVRMLGVAMPFARRGMIEAATFVQGLGLAVDMDLVNEAVLQATQTYSNVWWEEISQSTRNQLRAAITTWQESGLGAAGLPDLIDAIEPTFSHVRATRIATTETTRIFDQGNEIAYRAAGILETEWQTAKDELVDDLCRSLDGKRFPIGAGPKPVDDTHINCRCARLPVANDETLGKRS